MSDTLPDVFWEIHSELPRVGPGDNESTRKAFRMLKNLPSKPKILDIGCGTGMQTIELAKLTDGQIDALDNHQPFLDQLNAKIEKEGLGDRIRPVIGDMLNLGYADESFDLIWSEGAIFIIGFERGLREWRRLLTPSGYLVVSDLVWFQSDVPDELREFMEQGYRGDYAANTIDKNIEIAKRNGYKVINTFVLPEQSWWDNYYGWIEKKLPKLKEINKNDQEALQHIASEEKEIDMFRKYSKYYGYAFYIMQKQDFK